MQRLPLLLVLLCAFVQDGQGQDTCDKLTERMVNDLGRYSKHQCDMWDCGDVENQECAAAGITCASGAGRCGEDQVCCQSEAIATTVPTVGCPIAMGYSWYPFSQRCIKGYAEEKNYEDARAICAQDGGHLYHLKTPETDLQTIKSLAESNDDMDEILVGANDLEVRGQYQWGDSSLLATDLWGSGQPNKASQRCVAFVKNTLRLKTVYCYNPKSFVCQRDVVWG